jgi:hypothetical protein
MTVEYRSLSQLRSYIKSVLLEKASGSHPEEGYTLATSKSMFLEPADGGIEDEDKERIKKFLGDLGILH